MEGKLSQTTLIRKKREAKQQDPGLPNFNKSPQSYKRRKDIIEEIKTDKEPQDQFTEKDNAILDGDSIEQFGDDGLETADVDLNDQSVLEDIEIEVNVEPGCLRVHHHAPTWHLDKEPRIFQDLVMLIGLDRISEIIYEHCNSSLISAICERWQPETNKFHLSWEEMTLTLDDAQYLIGLLKDGDVPQTEGSWGLPKLADIFKNLYQDDDFFDSMKTGGQGNSLSLVKLISFFAGKLEKYNDSLQNASSFRQKKKIMPALSVMQYQALNKQNIKLVEDLRIRAGADDCNASLSLELAKKKKECELLEDINAKLTDQSKRQLPPPIFLVVIIKEEAVTSPDLQNKIDELTVKYEDAVKRLRNK
ncbi:hypothetical protein GIB67_038743 [Kingdonia uniflora]|uniref:Aminotransferase-like plant mobile domain-containing protein n=1 Tax=Kingdonia uniflora TaxID=39325 RepID=A0A7J7NT36_9MAGN|nr:hypothetical protein GIB67_038743 [Kingdonia uniflora]